MELQLITDPFERLLYFSLYFFTIHYCVTVVHVDQVFADDITVFFLTNCPSIFISRSVLSQAMAKVDSVFWTSQ